MSSVIFARPRTSYDSYTDLLRLIALSGYPLVYCDEIDPASDNTYILTLRNGENEHGWSGDVKARIILYDLEWRLEGDPPPMPGVCEVWAADAWYANQIGARYVPLGSHPELALRPGEEADQLTDVIMLSYMTNRRLQMAAWLRERGLSLAANAWGEVRHRNLLGSRLMLHVHQHDHVATVAPQRFALAAAYHLPLVSETVCEPGLFGDQTVIWSEYPALPDRVSGALRENGLAAFGEALHQLLCIDYPFRKCVEQAL